MAYCPALQALEGDFGLLTREPDHYTCILQLTALQDLKLICNSDVWGLLLPYLTCLTLLRTLSRVHFGIIDGSPLQDMAPLAALTQLTSLRARLLLSQWYCCLQALTGLKRVGMGFPARMARDALEPVLQVLPTPLEGLSWRMSSDYCAWPGLLRVISGMTRLDCLEVGAVHLPSGSCCLDESSPWWEGLVGLRQLHLVGTPPNYLDMRLLGQHLTALDSLHLCLDLFDGAQHLSALTRLTLLDMDKKWEALPSAQALGPPRFLTDLQLLRHLRLHWGVTVGEEKETIRCLASLTELERLHVTYVPVLPAHDHLNVFLVSKPRRGRMKMGIRLLKPVVGLGSLQELLVTGGYQIDEQSWERIHKLRERLGLPVLLQD